MTDALICFLKYPKPGQVKTRLARDLGAENACTLYRDLAERVITEVFPLNQTYELVLFVDPKHDLELYRSWLGEQFSFQQQSGHTLGDRMFNAGSWAFDEGYERVIIVGSDCVGMDEQFIGNAFSSLEKSDFVLGPSSDGGYYLIGLKPEFEFVFDDMPWSGPDLRELTLERIESREMKTTLLDMKQDVDTLDDLVSFRQVLPQEHFLAKKIDRMVLERLEAEAGSVDES